MNSNAMSLDAGSWVECPFSVPTVSCAAYCADAPTLTAPFVDGFPQSRFELANRIHRIGTARASANALHRCLNILIGGLPRHLKGCLDQDILYELSSLRRLPNINDVSVSVSRVERTRTNNSDRLRRAAARSHPHHAG